MNEVLQILIDQFKYDVSVFCNPWMYYFVFPILFYTVWFFVKWFVLTAPLWIPVRIILKPIKLNINTKDKE